MSPRPPREKAAPRHGPYPAAGLHGPSVAAASGTPDCARPWGLGDGSRGALQRRHEPQKRRGAAANRAHAPEEAA